MTSDRQGENGLETRVLWGMNDSLFNSRRILFTRQKGRRGYGSGQRQGSTPGGYMEVARPKIRNGGLRMMRGTGRSRAGWRRGVTGTSV